MKKLTRNQMKNEIRHMKESLPEGEFKPGLFIKKIGNKHIHILNTYDNSTIETMKIEQFHHFYC